MTDTTPNPDDVLPDAMARALTDHPDDGRAVLMVQETPGAALRWFLPDARYADGWREVTDRDEVGALVAGINAAQAARAEVLERFDTATADDMPEADAEVTAILDADDESED